MAEVANAEVKDIHVKEGAVGTVEEVEDRKGRRVGGKEL